VKPTSVHPSILIESCLSGRPTGAATTAVTFAPYSASVSGDSSTAAAVNVLYPRRMNRQQNRNNRQSTFQQQTASGYSISAAAAANAASQRATRLAGPLGSSATTPAGWSPGTDDRGTTSTGSMSAVGSYHQPRVITIVKADGGGRQPHDSLKTFVNRQNVHTFDQFARDVADAFEQGGQRQQGRDRRSLALGRMKKGGGARLFSIGGREVVGLADLFRADDVFIGTESGSAEPSTSEVRQIFEELYPGSAYVDVLVRKWTKARQRFNNRRYGQAFYAGRQENIAEESTLIEANKKSGRDSGVSTTSPRRGETDEHVDTETAPDKPPAAAVSRDSSVNGHRRKRWTRNRVNFDDKENREHRQRVTANDISESTPNLADASFTTSATGTGSTSKLPRRKRNKVTHGGLGDMASNDRLPPIDVNLRSEDQRRVGPHGDEDEPVTMTTSHRNSVHQDPRKTRATVGRRQLAVHRLPAIEGSSVDGGQVTIERDSIDDRKVRLSYTNRKHLDAGENMPPIRFSTAENDLDVHVTKSPTKTPASSVRTADKTINSRHVDADETMAEVNVVEHQKRYELAEVESAKDENANDVIDAKIDNVDVNKNKMAMPRPPTHHDNVDQVASEIKEQEDNIGGEPEVVGPTTTSKSEHRRLTAVFKSPLERQVSTVERVTEQYEMGKVLGDGNFAVVHQCRQRDTGREFALKIIDKSKMRGKEAMIENEILITKACRHTNIVRLYEEYETKTEIYLVMELVKVGPHHTFVMSGLH